MSEEDIIKKVREDYEKTLVIPAEKPASQFILCPVGLIGAGKTTVVKPLSVKLSLLRISSDEIRKLLKENGLRYQGLYEVGDFLVKKYLDLGYSLAIDADCASLHTRDLLKEVEVKYGLKLIWLHVNPPEEFIVNKLRNFKHTWLFTDGEAAVKDYLARKSLHEKLDMPFIYTFDTSRQDLPAQIDEVVRLIKKTA